MTHTEYLADNRSLISTLAQWHHREFGHFRPEESVAGRARRLLDSARQDGLPLTVVALSEGELLGSASLVLHDMDIRRNLSPWLADLYVAPMHRRHGVGSTLVRRAVQEATRWGFGRLYLFTTSPENERLYANLGWSVRERVAYLGKLRVIMDIVPGSPAP